LSQQQGGWKQEDQLVLDRSLGDFPDYRQFARRIESGDILRRHCGIVDHHARRLGPRAGGGGADIVDRGSRDLGDRGDIVEQGY